MAGLFGISIEHRVSFDGLNHAIKGATYEALHNCAIDLHRVAQERTPYKTGTLEESGTVTMSNSGQVMRGIVSFSAYNKGFNYAMWTDKASYNLGAGSRSKGGGRSAMYNGSLPVGKGYLSDTAEKCQKGYEEYISKKVSSTISSSGFAR